MSTVELLPLIDVITKILATSVVSGVLIAFTPWVLGMVVIAFKNIINKI